MCLLSQHEEASLLCTTISCIARRFGHCLSRSFEHATSSNIYYTERTGAIDTSVPPNVPQCYYSIAPAFPRPFRLTPRYRYSLCRVDFDGSTPRPREFISGADQKGTARLSLEFSPTTAPQPKRLHSSTVTSQALLTHSFPLALGFPISSDPAHAVLGPCHAYHSHAFTECHVPPTKPIR